MMIRLAKKEELSRVNELRKQVFDLHANGRPDLLSNNFGSEMGQYIDSYFNRMDADVLVAIKDDHICGFASIEYIEKPATAYSLAKRYYHIVEFGVDEQYRRQKIGSALFSAIKEQAKEKGFHRLELDVYAFNEEAIHFYESMGFRPYRIYMECE